MKSPVPVSSDERGSTVPGLNPLLTITMIAVKIDKAGIVILSLQLSP